MGTEESTCESADQVSDGTISYLYADGTSEDKRRNNDFHPLKCQSNELICQDFFCPGHVRRDNISSVRYEAPTIATHIPIRTVVTGRQKLCIACARHEHSFSTSDSLFYEIQPLLEKVLTTQTHPVDPGNDVDFSPAYNLTKCMAAEIFYSVDLSLDLPDFKSGSQSRRNMPRNIAQNGHPFFNKGYSRISEKDRKTQPISPSSETNDASLEFQINMDYDVDMFSFINYVGKREEEDELEQNRSSLLMLEPLLLLTNATTDKKILRKKESLAHSEYLKLIIIVTTYILSFLLLVSITFYLVYFT
jgi:hypothetical protein